MRRHDDKTVSESLALLSRLPMFAGIRTQVFQLHAEVNKLRRKMGRQVLPPLALPFVTLGKIWAA